MPRLRCGCSTSTPRLSRAIRENIKAVRSSPAQRALISGALLGVYLLLGSIPAFAQAYAQSPGDLLDQYRALRPAWFAAAAGAANRLFGILALIEFAWSAAVLVMERTDLQGWTAGLIKRMMFVGAFYALLVNGRTWIPAIIDSFEALGQSASGVGAGFSPGDVFIRGLEIAGRLLAAASLSGFLVNIAGSLALVLAALLTFFAFVIVCVHYMMAMVESYVVVGAGFIFLGFGGSRWTAPYVERYIALAVAVGVKIMVLYLLIGAGMTISAGWAARASGIGGLANPLMDALDIVGGAIIFMALCWQAPKFTASLLGGSPSFSGGDIAAIGLAGAQAAFVVGSVGAGAAQLLASRSSASGGMNVSQAAGMGAGGNSGSGGSGGNSGGGGGGTPSGGGSGGSPSGASGGNGGQPGGKGGGQPSPPNGPAVPAASTGGSPSSSSSGTISGGSTSQVPPPSPSFAQRVENQLDRAARRTAMLRQALPADGHAGSPAQLNLNGGE